MAAMAVTDDTGSRNDDPRKLRDLLERTATLARDHGLPSALVGVAAPEGEALFPDFVDFLESELRVEDGLFRMTRERAVVCLADVDVDRAREVMERLQLGFAEQTARLEPPHYALRYVGVDPGTRSLPVKDVLPALFAPLDCDAPH